ncbi:glycosyltransferase [Devosia sp. YR412]|uniref:glycosyltransferase family 2 protein n=1 Tax=Devosia sp. YR412 TaxID=1881030 RepID=UPI00147C1092|nr:glycosyltransferase [Devosia sp. YR412]
MNMHQGRNGGRPLVSVIMANFQAGDKIVMALRSVLDQSMGDLEVIVSDDASGDDSVARVQALMAGDPRIRLSLSETNQGPAHCRNRALEMARGLWIAVVDSDDILHPERFERLLAAAVSHDADIIADDLLLFHEDGNAPKLMLGEDAPTSFAVSPEKWVLAGMDGTPALGYLKPMIRAEQLGQTRYDESLRIGEDYDFVLRLLLDGARMTVVPEPFYLYRRHSASISHRLSVHDMQAMVERQRALVSQYPAMPGALAAAFAKRLAVLETGLGYEALVASIKGRRAGQALKLLAGDPSHLGRLWASFSEGRQRRDTQAQSLTQPSRSLTLGGQGVPAYVPAGQINWSAPRPRHVWRELAAHAGAECTVLDAAGRYAAGFIPEVRLIERHALAEAS